jgi:hypothetical protein
MVTLVPKLKTTSAATRLSLGDAAWRETQSWRWYVCQYDLQLCVWLRGGCVDCVCVRRVAQMVATMRWLALVMTVRV